MHDGLLSVFSRGKPSKEEALAEPVAHAKAWNVSYRAISIIPFKSAVG
jgi:hypothetical protein